MTPIDRFQRRYRHHAWAGSLLCAALESDPVPAAIRPFAHALAADRVWHQRLVGSPLDVDVWPALEVGGCRALWATTTAGWARVLEGADLEDVVTYQNTSGVAFETPVADIFDHVLLHAAHHRGQSCMALRAAGVAPPTLDLIAWVRAGDPAPVE